MRRRAIRLSGDVRCRVSHGRQGRRCRPLDRGKRPGHLRRQDRCVRMIGTAIDVTARKEAEERQNLLAREVDHRARNALAVIQSIVRLTRARSVDDYVAAVEGRIKALARAHTLFRIRDGWCRLATLVGRGIGALSQRRRQGEVGGPSISLQPHTAQGLALALHELATNAAKHGALSSVGGKVMMTWRIAARSSGSALERDGRSADCAAAVAQLRSQGHSREHRESAERQGQIRLGAGRNCNARFWIPQQEPVATAAARKTGKGAANAAMRAVDGALPACIAGGRRSAGGHDDPGMPHRVGQPVVGPIGRAADGWRRRSRANSTPRSSTSISATAWLIRLRKFCPSAASPSPSSPATKPTRSTSGSAKCRCCRSRLSGRCCRDCSCRIPGPPARLRRSRAAQRHRRTTRHRGPFARPPTLRGVVAMIRARPLPLPNPETLGDNATARCFSK